jgi:hypothetical protein
MFMITKAIEHKRGGEFSCIVTYNVHNDHIGFHKIVMPVGASKEVEDEFLAEAEKAMLNLIDSEWDSGALYRGIMG